jgi:predicted dehydrogenase
MIGVGIIGYGYWGPNLARCFAETEGCRLAAIADTSSDALARAGRRHPAVDLFEDWRRLVRHPRVDAVVIATPVRNHYELAYAALVAGKHVLVEKPMTQTSQQAEDLIETAARRGLMLMVDHTFVYTGAVQKLRELIAAGELGRIYYYDSTRVNLGLFQTDVNVIWDLAVHDLAILNYILDDDPAAVSANGASHVGGPENMAHVTLYYASGAIANLAVNWLAPVKVRQTLVGGSRKMVIYDDLEPSEKVKVYDRGIKISSEPEEVRSMRVDYRIGDMWAPRLATKEALLTEAEHFIACVRHGTTPVTDGRMGMRVVEALEAATTSMRRRGQPVDLAPLQAAS